MYKTQPIRKQRSFQKRYQSSQPRHSKPSITTPLRHSSTSSTPTSPTTTPTLKKKSKSPYSRIVLNPPRQILSGIQPTGVVHIGNLFGAVSNWVSLQHSEPLLRQQEYVDLIGKQRRQLISNTANATLDTVTNPPTDLPGAPTNKPAVQSKIPTKFVPLRYNPVLFSVVDLHAITIPRPAAELHDSVRTLTATLLGCGIDPQRANLFIQSHVTQHTELAWLLTCNTPVSWLYRMTQFKDKSQKLEKQQQQQQQQQRQHSQDGLADGFTMDPTTPTATEDNVPLANLPRGVMAGLLQYPALMAADILLYNATHVPVGDDQTQHLEFARELARTMNSSFSPIFVEPSPIHNPYATRVMSLRSPEMKMSKSDPSEQGKITLQDSDSEIAKRIRTAVTDAVGGVSYEPDHRPGLANLLHIYAASENMKILTSHYQKVEQQLQQTQFYQRGMLSLDHKQSESTSQQLFDFAMSTAASPLSNDPFTDAVNEFNTIMNQTPQLVTPQDLAVRHERDLLSVFKPAVADSLISLIAPIRKQTQFFLDNPALMEAAVKDGADTARTIAIQTVARTKDVMGMRF